MLGAGMLINAAPADAHITIEGHSYGGDAAFRAVQFRPMVDVFISIDPVAHVRVPWATVRSHCTRWLNVRAEPDDQHRRFDETIAWIGGKYPRPPVPGQPNAPDYSFAVNASHGMFASMMRATSRGISGTVLLGGRSVA